MPTALITGITGQDGSYLAEFLIDKGYQVIGMVRRSSVVKLDRIEHIQDKITLVQGDLLDQVSLLRVLQEYQPDEIYNLACPAAPGHYQYNPIKTMKTSVLGAVHECHARPIRVYNMTVDGEHTYYVGASRVLVHNKW